MAAVKMATFSVDSGNCCSRYRRLPTDSSSLGFGNGCIERSAPAASADTAYPTMAGPRSRADRPGRCRRTPRHLPPPRSHHLARVDDALLELRERRVAQLEHDLTPVDPPVLVAPLGEYLSGVEQLLVQARPACEAGVRERSDLHGVHGHARLGRRGRHFVAGLADDTEIAERAVVQAIITISRRRTGSGATVRPGEIDRSTRRRPHAPATSASTARRAAQRTGLMRAPRSRPGRWSWRR